MTSNESATAKLDGPAFLKEFGSKATSVHKTWVFTLNNYTEPEVQTLLHFEVTRLALGREIAPTTGTPHLQGFIAFAKGYRFSGIKKLNPRANWSKCISPMHAWNYMLKENDWTIIDNRKPGSRTDVDDYRDMIKAGASDRELADRHPGLFLRYSRTQNMRNAYITPRTEMTKCIVLFGKTGTGKSTYVKKTYPDADWLYYDGRFFSQYRNRDVVVFDDPTLVFRKRLLWDNDLFKRLINHTPMVIRILGSYQVWNPKLVIFLVNYWPAEYYHDEAIKRRITFMGMNEKYEPEELSACEVRKLVLPN